jgi:hypothetical protein
VSTDAIRAPQDDAATTELVTAPVADRCAACQAPLAPDQRYCVNCGERRGRARFSPETFVTTTTTTTTVSDGVPPGRRLRLSSGASLVAGVATLLIALGVGVLIGHDSNSTPVRAASPQIIRLGGGGTAANTTSSAPSTTGGGTAKSGKKAKTTVVHVTSKTAKAANAAASKVLGSSANGNLSKNIQQKVGGSCTGGAGCQNGKFTGNFFPGG